MTQSPSPSAAELPRRPQTVRRAITVGLVVGTILIAINQGDVFLAGQVPPLWQIILTYMVPYCVSSYSSAALFREMEQNRP